MQDEDVNIASDEEKEPCQVVGTEVRGLAGTKLEESVKYEKAQVKDETYEKIDEENMAWFDFGSVLQVHTGNRFQNLL